MIPAIFPKFNSLPVKRELKSHLMNRGSIFYIALAASGSAATYP
jgi:hypothetical protein